MYVCVSHVCLVPEGVRRGHQIPWIRTYRLLWAAMWCLEQNPGLWESPWPLGHLRSPWAYFLLAIISNLVAISPLNKKHHNKNKHSFDWGCGSVGRSLLQKHPVLDSPVPPNQAWWPRLIIPALGSWKQEDQKVQGHPCLCNSVFGASLDDVRYIVSKENK